jgi:hypothetical protein
MSLYPVTTFEKLFDLYQSVIDARSDYYNAVCGLIITRTSRVSTLDQDIEGFDLVEDTKKLHPEFIQSLFFGFAQKELNGKSGWAEPKKEDKDDLPPKTEEEQGKSSSKTLPKKSSSPNKTPLTGT